MIDEPSLMRGITASVSQNRALHVRLHHPGRMLVVMPRTLPTCDIKNIAARLDIYTQLLDAAQPCPPPPRGRLRRVPPDHLRSARHSESSRHPQGGHDVQRINRALTHILQAYPVPPERGLTASR